MDIIELDHYCLDRRLSETLVLFGAQYAQDMPAPGSTHNPEGLFSLIYFNNDISLKQFNISKVWDLTLEVGLNIGWHYLIFFRMCPSFSIRICLWSSVRGGPWNLHPFLPENPWSLFLSITKYLTCWHIPSKYWSRLMSLVLKTIKTLVRWQNVTGTYNRIIRFLVLSPHT